jgi:threonine dehydratase
VTTLLRTPLLRSTTLGDAFGGTAFLKAELFQKTGSFKPRGILAKLATLTAEERERGVITVSAGNAAGAVAYGCALEQIDCLVVMWQGTSELSTRRSPRVSPSRCVRIPSRTL